MKRIEYSRTSLILLCLLILLINCASEQAKEENIRSAQKNDNNIDKDDDLKDEKPKADDDDGDEVPTPDPLAKSKAFFTATIGPAFKEKCSSCHVQGNIGPLTIFEFTNMHALLMLGDTHVLNKLQQKIRNIEGSSHVGGDQCSTPTSETEICKKVVDWWYVTKNKKPEAPPIDPPPAENELHGSLVEIAESGAIRGWAAIANDETTKLEIKLYVEGGDLTQAVLMTSIIADQDAFDSDSAGSHAFTAEIAELYKDGKNYQLTAKAVFENTEHVLFGSPMNFSIGAMQSIGRQYYENTLRSKLEVSCVGCHSIAYETQKEALALPTNGASGTNNRLIRKAANLVNHGGGNRCAGGINSSPCAEIQVWWTHEFGN